ncbi:armadillo repeat-containing protein 10-like isoform X2 [Ornithodoros turicata]|uniref:armadillo repeat-containing protein 10-like isoform X2 n=1 Tax=Ornithodoros turicata TaxID=34597 RepID=UPI003138DBB6
MASEDVAVKRVALCSAIFAGFAYVGYSILRSAFCAKGNGRDDKERDTAHRSSQTDLSVPADYTTTSPAELHFIPKSVRNKVRELNLKARMFDDHYFARIFKPRSLQNSPWGSPKALSPIGFERDTYLSRSAENINMTPTTPLKRRNSSRSSRASLHWGCNDLSAECNDDRVLNRAMLSRETDDLLHDILHGLYNKARVMTVYEAKCLVTLLGSADEDTVVKTLTTISNCAAFTINQDYLCDVGCLPHLKELLSHDCPAVQVAATQAVANMAVNERNQRLLQPCVPQLLSAAVTCNGGRYLQSVSLLCLTNLALCDEVHVALHGSLHQLCNLIETAEGSTRLQTLKLLVNLSCSGTTVPYLLAARAPQNLHSLLESSDREVVLRILTYLANVVSYAAKHNITLLDLPQEHRAAAPEMLYAALCGSPARDRLQSVSCTLARSSDEDLSFQASRLHNALVR